MGMMSEFKAFALKGNVMDLAVGVIIGGAFGKIVNSLVVDIILPPIGVLIGGVKFTDLSITLKDKIAAHTEKVMEGGKWVEKQIAEVPAVTLNYGNFIQMVFEFLIIAFSIFIMIRVMNKAANFRKKKEEEVAAEAPPAPSNQEILLGEIRDLLKNK